MSLPDRLLHFHQRHRWLSHALYWLVVLLIAVSSSKYKDGHEGTYWFELKSDGLYLLAQMAYAYTLAYFVVPQFTEHKRYLLSAVAVLASSYMACVLGRTIIVKLCEPMAGIAPKAFETYTEILTNIPKLLYNYEFDMMAVAATFVFFKILKDQLIVQKGALHLEKEKAETELKLLKNQLNPHFLFNTLNNIYSLSFISQPATSRSIAGLAEILDHILYRCDGTYVPLSAEVDLLRNYIELQKLRYDERLTVNFTAHVDQDREIAPLILLSLVENAFKHGASEDVGVPIIDIDLKAEPDAFFFRVVNTVTSPNNGKTVKDVRRIGLSNLRRQLELIYGDAYTLVITQHETHFAVQLSIP
jgi:hypothetical protein